MVCIIAFKCLPSCNPWRHKNMEGAVYIPSPLVLRHLVVLQLVLMKSMEENFLQCQCKKHILDVQGFDRWPFPYILNVQHNFNVYGKFCLVAPFRMGFRKVMLHIKKVLSQKKGIDLNGNVCGFRQVSGYLFSEPVSLWWRDVYHFPCWNALWWLRFLGHKIYHENMEETS